MSNSATSGYRMPKLFVTGASGFIGAAVRGRLVEQGEWTMACLTRHAPQQAAPGVEWIEGELGDPRSYSEALRESDSVLHMAAATGAASEDELQRVNVEGTRRLLEACIDAGVRKFVHVSTIAVRYKDLSGYPYARTKRDAEDLLRSSGVPHAVIRPTIVLGRGSRNWAVLRKLACLPVVPLFGGGAAHVQPVDVADVAKGIELALASFKPGNVVELGGPETLSFAAFLQRIRAACGRPAAPVVHVPAAPVRLMLKLATAVLGVRVPVSPGQLSPFLEDSTARDNEVLAQLKPSMSPLDELLRRLAGD